MDDALADIARRKKPKRRIQAFDGSARVKCGGGAFSAIVWSLHGWEVVKARSGYLESLIVNEAEYNGLILGLDMLEDLDRFTRADVIEAEGPRSPEEIERSRTSAYEERVEWGCRQSSECRVATTRQDRGPGRARISRSGHLEPVGRNSNSQDREPSGASCCGHHPSFLSKITCGCHARGSDPGDTGRSDQAGSGGGSLDRSHEELSEWHDRRPHASRSKIVYGKIAADYEVDMIYSSTALPRRDRGMIAIDWSFPKRYNRTSYITITLRWKEDIREWGVPTGESGITSTGVGYIGAFSDMWGNAWIVKREKDIR
ncbi:LOW QUALITY PROTEIN: hypothetical protein PHMEG_00034155 [Phytophthora megakarya]|uniref:Reverse transcriptase n=1 Tax=Phytophthora megakarya TaxID=4795 RepID=A0A225URY9_9STRA|nr:LOW QUALITY PROTEIN: hypothetical protein PHMEG_00034155 [Phytophthora megakarya]